MALIFMMKSLLHLEFAVVCVLAAVPIDLTNTMTPSYLGKKGRILAYSYSEERSRQEQK